MAFLHSLLHAIVHYAVENVNSRNTTVDSGVKGTYKKRVLATDGYVLRGYTALTSQFEVADWNARIVSWSRLACRLHVGNLIDSGSQREVTSRDAQVLVEIPILISIFGLVDL